MYQGIDTDSLFRGHLREIDRYYKHLRRLDDFERAPSPGPGWQSPASETKRGPVVAGEGLRGRLLLRLGHVMHLAGAGA